jgi:hypothetical protein
MAKKYHKDHTPVEPDRCEHYCGVWYGEESGCPGGKQCWNSASDNWNNMDSNCKLEGWEPGALAFFTGGPDDDGHCCIGAHHKDTVFSTDYPKRGYVGHSKLSDIRRDWSNVHFQGWAKPCLYHGCKCKKKK